MLLSCVQDQKSLSTSNSSLLKTSISAVQLEALTGVTAGLWGDRKTLRERREYRIHTICDARFKPSDEDMAQRPLLQVVCVAVALSLSWDPALLCCYISCSEASWHSLAYHHAAQSSCVSEPIMETHTRWSWLVIQKARKRRRIKKREP